jgi:pimeloyl-ACP methyl ester carboxylesterase
MSIKVDLNMTDSKIHLVLIGGINNSAIVWDEFALHSPPWLELHRRVCPALDNVNDIAAVLLDDLPEEFYLCGFSFGGYVSLAILAVAKHRIKGLILANTQDGADSPGQTIFRQKSLQIASEGGYEKLVAGQADIVFHPDSAGLEHLKVIRERMVSGYGVERFMAHLKACITRPDSRELLSTSSMPVLVVAGEDDIVIPAKLQQAMAENIPDCTYRTIEATGHMMPLEKAGQFAQLVVDWIDARAIHVQGEVS